MLSSLVAQVLEESGGRLGGEGGGVGVGERGIECRMGSGRGLYEIRDRFGGLMDGGDPWPTSCERLLGWVRERTGSGRGQYEITILSNQSNHSCLAASGAG